MDLDIFGVMACRRKCWGGGPPFYHRELINCVTYCVIHFANQIKDREAITCNPSTVLRRFGFRLYLNICICRDHTHITTVPSPTHTFAGVEFCSPCHPVWLLDILGLALEYFISFRRHDYSTFFKNQIYLPTIRI